MSVLNENQLLGAPSASYQIQRSLRFNSADSAYLSRTPASAGNRKTWTFSCWVKRSSSSGNNALLASDAATPYNIFGFASDNLRFESGSFTLVPTQVFRDFSAWQHIVLAVDTTQATASDRAKIYVNGSQITSFTTATYPALNEDLLINNNQTQVIGRFNAARYHDGYLADIHFIDGQALTPASFGQTDATTGEWVPIAYTGTYGTNGFKLNFSNNSAATATTLGADSSGNGNNWTPNNLSVTAGAGNDSLVDTPTSYGTDTGVGGEVRGNYCTLNPLAVGANSSQITYANGNLEATWAATAGYATTLGTIGVSSGKWYWETTITATSSQFGIATASSSLANYVGAEATSYGYFSNTGQKWNNAVGSAYGNTFTTNDVIGIALDLDNGRLFFSKNGVWQNSGSPTGGTGAAFTGLSGTFFPAYSEGAASSAASYAVNFGQRQWSYPAPAGFKALCDTNLPAPTIVKPSTVMDVKLYTGNGSTQTISGLGFSPDLLWFKARSTTFSHQLYDTVRGVNKAIYSNLTDAELTVSSGVTAFNSDGASLGTETGINNNGTTYAAWCWDAGSSTVTNTAGTIQSSVRANTSAGFSVVTYTGTGANATVGHGLGVAPGLVIVKSRGANLTNWGVWHSTFAGTEYALLSTTGAKTTDATMWNSTSPSSSVFSLGTNATVNQSTLNYVAYCFAPVAGYSAFGSYTGNGSADGPFVYTGFRPRWVMIRCSSTGTSTNWWIFDTTRDPYNVSVSSLAPNASSAETVAGGDVDFLSNGFKLRDTYADTNGAYNYIYAAFAEFPFQYARAR